MTEDKICATKHMMTTVIGAEMFQRLVTYSPIFCLPEIRKRERERCILYAHIMAILIVQNGFCKIGIRNTLFIFGRIMPVCCFVCCFVRFFVCCNTLFDFGLL